MIQVSKMRRLSLLGILIASKIPLVLGFLAGARELWAENGFLAVSDYELRSRLGSFHVRSFNPIPTTYAQGIWHEPFVYPIMSPRMSSDYGMRIHPIRRFSRKHNGIDLAAPQGATIRAIAKGTVVFADPYAGYGNLVVVRHAGGMTSHYGHCSKIRVKPGQTLNAGQVIGSVGSTGLSTAPHLHFEIRINGVPRDPEEVIPGLAKEAKG